MGRWAGLGNWRRRMNEAGNREETVFNQAMGLPTPEARAAFLKQACAGDDQWCQRVCMKIG